MKPDPFRSDYYVLSTGKTFYAHNGIIGLSPRTPGDMDFSLSEGYDGGIDAREFTNAELGEIADFMIQLWQAYKSEVER